MSEDQKEPVNVRKQNSVKAIAKTLRQESCEKLWFQEIKKIEKEAQRLRIRYKLLDMIEKEIMKDEKKQFSSDLLQAQTLSEIYKNLSEECL